MVMLSSYPKRGVPEMEEKSVDAEEMSEGELHKMLYTRLGRRKRSFFNPEFFWKRVTRDQRQENFEEDLEKMLFTRVGR